MKKIPVAAHLNDQEYLLFMQVYADHNSSMGMSEREKYNAGHIVKIERAPREKALKIHYDNGDWWYYGVNHKWW